MKYILFSDIWDEYDDLGKLRLKRDHIRLITGILSFERLRMSTIVAYSRSTAFTLLVLKYSGGA